MRLSRLGHVEHAENVGLERPLQLRFGDVADVLVGMLLAGIVDEHVEPPELVDGFLDRALAETLVADVAGNGDRPASFLFDNVLGLGGIVVLAQVQDGDVGAFAREQGADRAANAAVAAGDDGDLAVEPTRSGIARLPAPGTLPDRAAQLAVEAGAVAVSEPLGADPEVARTILARYAVGAVELRPGLSGLAEVPGTDRRPHVMSGTVLAGILAAPPRLSGMSSSLDVVVLGAGPGGYVAAIRASQLGKSVAVVEDKYWGGVCLNVGCIPSKALLRNAELAHMLTHEKDMFGILGDATMEFGPTHARRRKVSEGIVQGVHFLMKKNKITEVDGWGTLTGPQSMDVKLTTAATRRTPTPA